MSSTLCETEITTKETAAKTRQAQKDVWRLYARSGPGSEMENNLVEQYLPLVRTVVGRLAHALHGVTGWYSAVEGELAGRRDSQAGRVRGSSAADLGNRHANA